MRTLAVMVCRNGLHMTKNAVKSILAQTEPCDILLIDNASSDGTAQYLDTLRDPVMTIQLVNQIPLAAAWNIGLHIAFDRHGYDAAWIVNNDVLFRPDTLHWLNADDRPFVTGVSVRTEEALNADIGNPLANWRPFPDFSNFRLKRDVWDAGLRFDEGYELAFCEDNQFHLDCHRAGIGCVCINVPFLHYGSATIVNADPAEKRRIQQAATRNRVRFRQKNGCEVGSPEYYALFTFSLPQSSDQTVYPSSNETLHSPDSESAPDEPS